MLQSPSGPSPQQTRLKFKAHRSLFDDDHLYEHTALNKSCVKALHLTGDVPIFGSSQPCLETKVRQKMSHDLLKLKAKHHLINAPQNVVGNHLLHHFCQ